MPKPTMKRKTEAASPPPEEIGSIEEAPEAWEDDPEPDAMADEPILEDPRDVVDQTDNERKCPEDPDELPTAVIVDLLASMAGSLATIAGILKKIHVDMGGGGSVPEFISAPNRGRPAVQKTMFGTPNMNKTSNKPPAGPICPSCDVPMVRRNGNRGPFWGCHNFPGCRQTAKYATRYEEEE